MWAICGTGWGDIGVWEWVRGWEWPSAAARERLRFSNNARAERQSFLDAKSSTRLWGASAGVMFDTCLPTIHELKGCGNK